MLEAAAAAGFPLQYANNEKDVLGAPAKIGRSTVANRLVAQPIEGFDSKADGAPSERSIERYCRLVRGGFRVLWMESVSVDEQGRSNPYQLWIQPGNVEQFRQMVEDIDFIIAFTGRMVNAAKCPVGREIPANMKDKLDIYLARKRDKK